MKLLFLGLPFLAAAALSLGLTPLAKRLAVRLGAMDVPNERKVHKTPIPRLGGVAVVVSFAVVCAAVVLGLLPVPRAPQPGLVPGLFLGLLPVFVVSFLDDVKSQRAITRLAAHSIGAAVVLASGFVLNPHIHLFGGTINVGVFAFPLSFFWIVGLTNAFNLIDGLDGLSAGLAFISSVSLAGVFLIAGRVDVAVVPLVLAGALLGFLRYNVHPASVFLGDSGACSVGFVLACLCLKGGAILSAGLAVLVPVLIVGVPLADTALSIVRRLLARFDTASGLGVMDADNGHIHHKLLGLGINQRRAVLLLYAAALVGVAVAFGSLFISATSAAVFLLALLGAGFVGVSRLGYDELAVVRKGTFLRIYDLPALKTGFFVGFADLLMAVVALYLAVGLKWDDWDLTQQRHLVLELGAAVPILVFVTFHLFGLYKGRWRHATIEDFLRPSAAALVTGVGAGVVDAFAVGEDAPASFFVVFTLLLLLLANASRSSYRLLAYWRAKASAPGVPVLLYGAGRRGSMAVRELMAWVNAPLRAVGFVDDDPDKAGLFLNGIPVVGTLADLDVLVERYGAKGVVVTTPKVPASVTERLEEACAAAGISFIQFNVSFEGTILATRTGRPEAPALARAVEPLAPAPEPSTARPFPTPPRSLRPER